MPTTTGPTVLYSIAETAQATLVNGSAYTLPTSPISIEATIAVYLAQVNTTAPGTTGSKPPNRIAVQVNHSSSDDTTWVDYAVFSGGTTASVTTTTNGSVSAAATSVTLTGSGTFGTTSQILYFRDSSSTGEWVRMQSQSTTTLTVPSPGCVSSHSSGISVYDQAIKFPNVLVPTGTFKRVRLQVDNACQATTCTIAVYAEISTYSPN